MNINGRCEGNCLERKYSSVLEQIVISISNL